MHPGSFVGSGYRQDLFGCIDMIAIRVDEVLAVQSCGTDWSGHWKKLTTERAEPVSRWLETGQPFLLIGWRKLAAGWCPRLHYFLMTDILAGCEMARHRTRDEWDKRVL